MTYMDEHEYRIWFEMHRDEIMNRNKEDGDSAQRGSEDCKRDA